MGALMDMVASKSVSLTSTPRSNVKGGQEETLTARNLIGFVELFRGNLSMAYSSPQPTLRKAQKTVHSELGR